jgi:hypothetical protein
MEKASAVTDTAIRVLVAALLVVAIWRIEVVNQVISKKAREGSGQIIAHCGVETERWFGETKEDWVARHFEAVEQSKAIEDKLADDR